MSDEVVLQFLDTNVLVYAHDPSSGLKHKTAVSLVQQLWADRQGCLSVQVLQEFYVIVTRKVAHPLSSQAASDVVAQLALWRIHRPAPRDVLDAITLHTRYEISFWDAMIVQSAFRTGCGILWSEDLSEGQNYGNLVVRNPFG